MYLVCNFTKKFPKILIEFKSVGLFYAWENVSSFHNIEVLVLIFFCIKIISLDLRSWIPVEFLKKLKFRLYHLVFIKVDSRFETLEYPSGSLKNSPTSHSKNKIVLWIYLYSLLFDLWTFVYFYGLLDVNKQFPV